MLYLETRGLMLLVAGWHGGKKTSLRSRGFAEALRMLEGHGR